MADTPIDWEAKAPEEVVHYGIDFTDGLEENDTLTGVVWAFAVQAGLTKGIEFIDGNIARVTLSGGTVGQRGELIATVTTQSGETLEERARIKVKAK